MQINYGWKMNIENTMSEVKLENKLIEKSLNNDDLARAGLYPISAFIRAEKSKNASRVKKSRLKSEGEGLKQLNVQARPEIHSIIKEIAKGTQETSSTLPKILKKLLIEITPKVEIKEEKLVRFIDHNIFERNIYALGGRVASLVGWRRKVVIFLGIL